VIDNIDDVRKMPTSIERDAMRGYLATEQCSGVHESVLRAYQILSQVKIMLEAETPPDLVLDLILLMESPLPEARP
jgi:hypothetical protein